MEYCAAALVFQLNELIVSWLLSQDKKFSNVFIKQEQEKYAPFLGSTK
jgi:hypothetical protein